VEALVDVSETQQLEANEKAAAASALASVLQCMQQAQPVVQSEELAETENEQHHQRHPHQQQQQQQPPSARQIDPRVLRADRLKGAGGRDSNHRSSGDSLRRVESELPSPSPAAAVTAEAAPGLRHISAEHVGSTSKWKEVATSPRDTQLMIHFLPARASCEVCRLFSKYNTRAQLTQQRSFSLTSLLQQQQLPQQQPSNTDAHEDMTLPQQQQQQQQQQHNEQQRTSMAADDDNDPFAENRAKKAAKRDKFLGRERQQQQLEQLRALVSEPKLLPSASSPAFASRGSGAEVARSSASAAGWGVKVTGASFFCKAADEAATQWQVSVDATKLAQ